MKKVAYILSKFLFSSALFMLLFVNFSFLSCYGFSQSITWQRTYDGPTHWDDAGYKACNADNGNFYICGITIAQPSGYHFIYVLKINPYGDTLWTRQIGDNLHGGEDGFAIVESGDGGCVLTGGWYPAFTIKFNTNGDIVWEKFYGGDHIQCYDIKKTLEGGYIFCGNFTGANINGYVGKTDSSGNIQWQKIYPSGEMKVFRNIELAFDGGYVMSGWNQNSYYDTVSGLIVKIDSAGNQLWEKDLGIANSTGFYSLTKSNNCYIAAGETGINNPFRVFFTRFDINGNIFYTKLFTTTRSEHMPRITALNPNEYIIALVRDSSALFYPSAKVLITDSTGSVLVEKRFYARYGSYFAAILPIANGDLLFTGGAGYDNIQNDNVYVVRTDSLLYAPPPIGIIRHNSNIPKSIRLYPNYPNPFNPTTTIEFDLPKSSEVHLTVYDLEGRRVAVLINQNLDAGNHTVDWDASSVASGVYFIRLTVDDNISYYNKAILIH